MSDHQMSIKQLHISEDEIQQYMNHLHICNKDCETCSLIGVLCSYFIGYSAIFGDAILDKYRRTRTAKKRSRNEDKEDRNVKSK